MSCIASPKHKRHLLPSHSCKVFGLSAYGSCEDSLQSCNFCPLLLCLLNLHLPLLYAVCTSYDAFSPWPVEVLMCPLLYRAKFGARQQTGFETFWKKVPGQARQKQTLTMATPEAVRKQGQRGLRNPLKRQYKLREEFGLNCGEMLGSNANHYIRKPAKVSLPLTEHQVYIQIAQLELQTTILRSCILECSALLSGLSRLHLSRICHCMLDAASLAEPK